MTNPIDTAKTALETTLREGSPIPPEGNTMYVATMCITAG